MQSTYSRSTRVLHKVQKGADMYRSLLLIKVVPMYITYMDSRHIWHEILREDIQRQ